MLEEFEKTYLDVLAEDAENRRRWPDGPMENAAFLRFVDVVMAMVRSTEGDKR